MKLYKLHRLVSVEVYVDWKRWGKDTIIVYFRTCVEFLTITKMEHYRQPDALHSSLRQSVYSSLFITDLQ